MAKVCTNCGNTLNDNAKFCMKCGTPVQAAEKKEQKYCVQCGNLLRDGLKFCEVCGREVASEKPKEEKAPEEPATMDELVIPEIDESTFGTRGDAPQHFDGFEAAVLPDTEIPEPAAPAPTPEFSMDTAYADKPKPAPAPAPAATAPKPAPAPRPAPNVQNPYPNAAANIPAAPKPADNGEKGGSNVVPIILAVLIVLVLIADAIIFLGHNDDKDNEKSAYSLDTAITAQLDE